MNLFCEETENNEKTRPENGHSMENSKEVNYTERVKRKTRVGPWRKKAEFDMVYKWLFGENATEDTWRLAVKQMIIWKARRLNLTPAAILATLTILEIKLKDKLHYTDSEFLYEIRLMHSSAITRFFNFMSSIVQEKGSTAKTMYETAELLGIKSFLVDVRHLCSHGQVLPSIDILRRSTNYSLNWLKKFYWDPEKENILNVDAKNIRQKEKTDFDDNISELFFVYDYATECICKNSQFVKDGRKVLSLDQYNMLKKFSNLHEEKKLKLILAEVVKEISEILKRSTLMADVSSIFLEALLKMNFFFKTVAKIVTSEEIAAIVKLHRGLFRKLAMFGFLENFFYEMILICENDYEFEWRRHGASFWATQVAMGFDAFCRFKIAYKQEIDKDPNYKIDISTVNSPDIAKKVRRLYSNIGIDTRYILIFGDTLRRPWSLTFSRNYIEERMKSINEYTAAILKECLNLVQPPLSESEIEKLKTLIDVYLGREDVNSDDNVEDKNKGNSSVKESAKVYTLQSDILNGNSDLGDNLITLDDVEMREADGIEQKYGVWSTVPDDLDWQTCPLGRLPWE